MVINLLEIKSQYNLKWIFSFLDYDLFLKLIKNNKKFQKILEINIRNYEERSNYEYHEIDKELLGPKVKYCMYLIYSVPPKPNFKIIFFKISTSIAIILFIYVLIFASLLAAKGSFDENNTKENYDKNIAKIINKINKSLFGFLAYIILSYFLYLFSLKEKYRIFLIVNEIIYLIYEIIIIVKLILSYKIIKSKISWFICCDYVLIIFIFIYIAFFAYLIYHYYCKDYCKKKLEQPEKERKEMVTLLVKFREIEIVGFELSNNFKVMNDYEKRKYVLKNKNRFILRRTEKGNDLFASINEFRNNNNIDILSYEEMFFEDLIIDKYSEHIFYNYENIFKFANGNYLLKYHLDEFKTKFNNEEKNIIDILLNVDLKKIIIFEKNNYEYIYIFKSENKSFNYVEKIFENINVLDSKENVIDSNETIEKIN